MSGNFQIKFLVMKKDSPISYLYQKKLKKKENPMAIVPVEARKFQVEERIRYRNSGTTLV